MAPQANDDPLGVRGRVAIVTGAASGYGRATAELFAARGISVVAADVNERGLLEVSNGLSGGSRHMVRVLDVSNVLECSRIVEEVIARYGRLDILVNVSAVLAAVNIDDVDEQHWARTLDVNLKGPYFLSRAAAVPMRKARWGRIINFISTAGITGGTPAVSVYGISKAGLIAMTQSFARNFGRDNVLVNAISPATLKTPLFRRGLSDTEVDALGSTYVRNSLFGRWTEPVEVARSVLYLASELSSAVTGHVLRADSGAALVNV
jgi:3-oxoacyl-[acyl-carrier protein] reductase